MMRASQVFTPGRFPTHTFVDDHLKKKKGQLLDTLETGSMLVSVSGPSKSGKTVFIEECLGRDSLIQVTGAGVLQPADLWMRVFDIIGTEIPHAINWTTSQQRSVTGKTSLEGSMFVAKGKGEASASSGGTESEGQSARLASDYLQLLIRELSD